MKDLKITKGEWIINIVDKGKIFIEAAEQFIIKVYSFHIKKEEAKSNAELIVDAANTAQKCNLLPSELLERYNEAIEALKHLTANAGLMKYVSESEGTLLRKSYESALQAIKKAQQ